MSQCVPSWDVEDNSSNGRCLKTAFSNSMSANLDVPILDYEVAELTWKNGQLSMHGLGPPRLVYKSQGNNGGIGHAPTWDKPRATETLEAIVDQATLQPHGKPQMDELVPWLGHDSSPVVARSVTMTMDALVPQALLSGANTRVGSCSVDRSGYIGGGVAVAATHEWESVSCSETFGMESSRQMTSETELGVKGLTSVSMGSPQETVSAKRSTSPEDSVGHSKRQKNELEEKRKGKGKSSITTKRSRAAAIHNQSERKRRDKINEKMQTLQKLVPNANKTDKASMLDEVIEYLKQLQAQVQMMGRMNISPMMMPLAMQQLQMAMMNPVGMGIGMGMGMGMPGVMDLNTIGGSHPNIPAMPQIFHPSSIMQPVMASWDMNTFVDRVQSHNDPMAAFLATQSQPMTMEGYSRMAALFQHMQNQPCYSSGHKNGNN